ncbi:hypothetical protein CVT26_013297 [Gymnopilus dilepis]|uniref:Methyltransferase domain-containing protein n=1 Tax=Gymnopilus dilepis TaxID=231916 RepID=A0A409VUN1_9AGAR|nr:hypothetical protein CVT26_013297 [Gymnopilus dilepis]
MEAMHKFYADPATKPGLDPSLYSLQPDELEFLQTTTGIKDEQELKDHILRVQKTAYEVRYTWLSLYSAIQLLEVCLLLITWEGTLLSPQLWQLGSELHVFQHIQKPSDCLENVKTPSSSISDAVVLGNDTRKIVLDGWPAQSVIASDLIKGFWDRGHELFQSTPESFPVRFIQGDIFDSEFLSVNSPSLHHQANSPDNLDLASITSLAPLRNRISAIHVSALFHLFSEEQQLDLARRLASLLVSAKGSIVFGAHVSRPVKGFRSEVAGDKGENILMFCHSPDSWRKMWVEDVFGSYPGVHVDVEAKLVDYLGVDVKRDDTAVTEDGRFYEMQWSVEIVGVE